jgi:2-hydroxychromene-2-carboxylate isomerase
MKDDAPPGFPPRTLTAMRAVSAVTLLDGENSQGQLTRVLDALFHGLWVEHRPVHEPETLQVILRSVLGEHDSKYGR